MILIEIALWLSLGIFSGFFCYKYLTLKKSLKQYTCIGTGKFGFYKIKFNFSSYNSIVYIKEIDRFTNGYSKIEISNIEPLDKNESTEAIKQAKNNFVSLILTQNIEWLEGENSIKRIRKEKLEKLEKI